MTERNDKANISISEHLGEDDNGHTNHQYFRLASTGHPKHKRRSSFMMKKNASMRFSVFQSTEQQHRSTEKQFYGAYAHLRKKLDYNYHSYYVKERQWLQDSIIEDMLDNEEETGLKSVTPTEPWLVYTVGAQGAGKHFTIQQLVHSGRLPLLSYVLVDPDEIRRRLPEFSTYVEKCPELVDSFTNKESGYVAEILTLAALQAGTNVVLDGALQDGEWHAHFFESLRQDFPCLKIAMIHVVAPQDIILQRASAVAMDTGRVIDSETIQDVLEKIPQSIEACKPFLNYFCVIHNVDSLELDGEEWQTFTSTFVQMPLRGQMVPTTSSSSADSASTTTVTTPRKSRKFRRFSVFVSTETNHQADHTKFYGRYSHIRETLDYSYHRNYTFERQKFQDAIVDDFLDAAIIKDKNGELCSTPTEPWIVFTAGAMGAGKSYTMSKLVEKGRFPLLAFVLVDPDEIRRRLPEFHLYVDYSPELAGELTRKEAGFISEILTLAGLQAGKNVLVDGSLRDSEWYKVYFQRLRNEFTNLKLSIIHVTAPREAVFQRAAERAQVTGRIVPREVLEAALEQVPKSVKILGPLVDYFCEINNAPGLPDVELTTPGETWETFQSQWVQTCAYVPKNKKFLRKASSDLLANKAQ